MSLYEITYILRPALEDPNVDELVTHFSDVAKNNGAETINIERMGKKRLAYDIQKTREGHYVCMHFSGSSECAKEVVRQMRLHENVLRALLIKPDHPFVPSMLAPPAPPNMAPREPVR